MFSVFTVATRRLRWACISEDMMEAANRDPYNPQRLLNEWMTRAELAAALDVSEPTLARWASRKIGPVCIRIGRRVLYRREAVKEWMVAQERRRPSSGGRK